MTRTHLLAIAALAASCAAPATGDPGAAGPALPSAGVDWQDWSPAAFEAARTQHRLILVDVVAEWCHWCHVMDKTTYADPEVVKLLAQDYVAVRVDSDAHPDVAERYREWGWPATAILTPDAEPVLERRGYQEPAEFAKLLRRTAADFRAGRPIARTEEAPAAAAPSDLDKVSAAVADQLDRLYDQDQAGWGRPQKYPFAAPVEEAFLRSWLRRDSLGANLALATLAKETRIVDPVWGGMYQYSTDGDWDHPHFEKIVPVQAGAMSNFALAARMSGDKAWLPWAKAIQRYVQGFLTADDGAFFTSQDADLGAHGDAPEWLDGHRYFSLDDARRREHGIPRVDESIYADRNGMLVAALCDLYEASGDATALNAARKTANRILKTHSAPTGGFTHAGVALGAVDPPLFLPDQVEMGFAFLALAEAGAEPGRVAQAERVADALLDRFEDKVAGGFWARTLDEKAAGVFAERRKPFEENARAARFLLRLSAVTGETLWREAALRAVRFFASPEALRGQGRAVGDYLMALEEIANPPAHVTVVGKPGAKDPVALYAAALRFPAMDRVIDFSPPGEKYPDAGKAAVYVCTASACSAPITDLTHFDEQIRKALGR